MKIRRHWLLGILGLGLICTAALLWLIYLESQQIQQREKTTAAALHFSNELRSESRQLTSLARNAVIMGDQESELSFHRLLDTRHGKLARSPSAQMAPGEKASFELLVRRLEISVQEEQALLTAFLGSERLALREIQAMYMARGFYAGSDGEYSVQGTPQREKALDLLFDQYYRKSAMDIMEQVNVFFEGQSRRLNDSNAQSHQRMNVLLGCLAFSVIIVFTAFTLLVLRFRDARTPQRRLIMAYAATMMALLLSVAGPSWLVYSDARSVLLETAAKRQALLAREVEREFELRVSHAVELARIAALRPPIQTLFETSPNTPAYRTALRRAEEVLQKFTVGYADVARTVLLSKDNKFLASGAVSGAAASLLSLPPDSFHKLLLGQSLVLPLENTLADGATIAPEGQAAASAQAPTDEEFSGEVLVAVPVLRGDEVEGAMVMVLDKRYALSFWDGRLAAAENTGILLLNAQGRIIVASLGDDHQGKLHESQDLLNFMAEGRQGQVRFTGLQGDTRMGYFVRLQNLPWVVGVTNSYTSITDQAGQVLVRSTLFGAAGVLLTITLVSLLLRYFTSSLRSSNQRIESIIEGAGMFTWDYHVRQAVFQHNAQWCRVAHVPGPAEDGTLPISWLLDRLHPDDAHFVSDLAGKLTPKAVLNFEFRLRMPSGEYRWLANMGRVEAVDSAGYTLRAAGTGFDIHDRKMAELTRAEQKQQLEDLVAQRTRELVESRNHAEAASQAKSTFLSTVSHEIRTPMNAIVGFTHLFKRANLDNDQKAFLDKIKLSADTLLNIINDVLDISKIEAGKLELEHMPFSLQNVLRTVQSVAEYAALEKKLQLATYVAGNVPPYFYGDSKRISQILLNLLNNAIKFTSQGQVKLAVLLGEEVTPDKHGALLAVSVTDTGIGLSEEQMSRLFKPFSQADSSVTRKYGGTGLGLAICKELVEIMGGRIGVESQLGKGSTFFFTLRLTVAETLPEEDDFSPASVKAAEKATERALTAFAGSRILVVEDNTVNQEIACMVLESCGMVVDTADHGRDAIDKVQSEHYALIFMDMQMPVMGGEEATRRLREMGNIPEFQWLSTVPVIAMTANVMAEDRQRCLQAGMNDHLPKPFDPAALRALLLRWLH